MADEPFVFFAYSREDEAFTLALANTLTGKGAHLWVDQWRLEPSVDWDAAIDRAIERCTTFLVVLSPRAVESREVRGEIRGALDLNKPIVPVLFEKCQIPRQLKVLQAHHTGRFLQLPHPCSVTARRV